MFTISTLSFLESPDNEAAMDFAASEVMESEVLYDCVICGQSGPSTDDRPFGLVVLLQASSGTSCTYTLSLTLEMLNLNKCLPILLIALFYDMFDPPY